LAFAEDGSGDVYAATEAGAWKWERASGTWLNIMEPGTPLTIYWSVEAVPSEGLMRFGTYGRGIWDHATALNTDGTWTIYGEDASPQNYLTLNSQTPPNLGTTIHWDVAGALLPNGNGWIVAGRKRGELPFGSGVQLVDQVVRNFSFHVFQDGTGTRSLHLPNFSSWIGIPFRFQAVIPDLAAPGGYALSNGLEAVFGI